MSCEPEAGLGDRHNLGFMSTVITYGRGQGLVIATGMETEIGKIAEMIQSYEEEPTPLQVKLDQLGRTLGIITLVICGLVGVIGIVRDTQIGVLFSQGFSAYFGLEETIPNWSRCLWSPSAWPSPLCPRACRPWSPLLWPWACKRWSSAMP